MANLQPAIGESNSGMPRNVQASAHAERAVPEVHFLAGCGRAKMLVPIEACSILS